MRRYCMALAAALIALPGVRAQEEGEDREAYLYDGLSEISLNAFGAWNSPEDSDIDQYNIGGEVFYGIFLTDWLEVGAKAEYEFIQTENDALGTEREDQVLLAAPQITVNLLTDGAVVPFALVAGGIAYTRTEIEVPGAESSDDEVGAFWEAGGGIRLFLTESASVNLSVRFRQLLFEDIEDIDSVVGTAGISIYF